MSKRPHIVFMIADDHRHSAIDSLHHQGVKTPNLDRLVSDGTAFLNTHIMGGWHRAVCAPSRACVLTGGNVYHAAANEPEPLFDDVMKNHCEINPEMKTLPEILRKAGYRTHAIGKWHNDRESFRKGFSEGSALFFGGMSEPHQIPLHAFDAGGDYSPERAAVTSKHATERFADAGVRFIEQYDGADPFLLYMAFTAPHDPRIAPKAFADLYDPQNIPLPTNFMPVHPFDNGEMHVRDEGLARLPRDPQEVCSHIADYYAMISHLDSEVGRVLQALQAKGLEEDTIVVYTADHGLAIGQHGLMGKQNLYDHSIRVPFILRGPGVTKAKRIDALSCQMDIMPTLCELAGLECPETADGTSLVPLITGQSEAINASVFSAYKDVQRMVKKGSWKMIRYYRSEKEGVGSEQLQLFNLTVDPWETNNLSTLPQYQDTIQDLLAELKQWQQRVGDPILKNQ